MKIYEFCPFLNENSAAEIKIKEDSVWVDQLHIIESNKTFSNDDKDFNFNKNLITDKVIYHAKDVSNLFRNIEEKLMYYSLNPLDKINFIKWYWMLMNKSGVFYNESIQRNFCKPILNELVEDNDIVILSDIDEIIDSRFADRIISEVKKHQIISINLYVTAFYLNLFCPTRVGAPNYCYRIFIMTGRYFKLMPFTSDYLRKNGFENRLVNNIYKLNKFAGFHHSLLDYKKTFQEKKNAYRCNSDDKTGLPEDYAEACIKNKRLYHLHTKLYVDNKKTFLQSLKEINTENLFYKNQ
jgi:hypothetical protein